MIVQVINRVKVCDYFNFPRPSKSSYYQWSLANLFKICIKRDLDGFGWNSYKRACVGLLNISFSLDMFPMVHPCWYCNRMVVSILEQFNMNCCTLSAFTTNNLDPIETITFKSILRTLQKTTFVLPLPRSPDPLIVSVSEIHLRKTCVGFECSSARHAVWLRQCDALRTQCLQQERQTHTGGSSSRCEVRPSCKAQCNGYRWS